MGGQPKSEASSLSSAEVRRLWEEPTEAIPQNQREAAGILFLLGRGGCQGLPHVVTTSDKRAFYIPGLKRRGFAAQLVNWFYPAKIGGRMRFRVKMCVPVVAIALLVGLAGVAARAQDKQHVVPLSDFNKEAARPRQTRHANEAAV